MRLFNLNNLLKNYKKEMIDSANNYYLSNKVKDLAFNYTNDIYLIQSTCNFYHNQIKIKDNQIIDYECNCSLGKYGIVCKHILASIMQFNDNLDIANSDDTIFQFLDNKDFINIYKKILLIDYLAVFSFGNNFFKIININEDLINLDENLLTAFFKKIETAKNSFIKDFNWLKVIKIIDEFKKIKPFILKKENIYQNESIDEIFNLINSSFEYVDFIFKGQNINNINIVDYSKQKLIIKCDVIQTIYKYCLNINFQLIDYIFSNHFLYLLLKENKLFFYKIPYVEIKTFNFLKKSYIETKRLDLINQKINELNQLEFFDVKIKNMINTSTNKIHVNVDYDEVKDKIIFSFNKALTQQEFNLLNKKIGNKWTDYYNYQKNQIILKNNFDFDQYENALVNDEHFTFHFATIFQKQDYPWQYSLDIKNKYISFDLNNKNIHTNEDFLILKNAFNKQKKFVKINGQIFQTKSYHLDSLIKKFNKYNLTNFNYNNNLIDFKNIFSLPDELMSEKITKFIDEINSDDVHINLDFEKKDILKDYQIQGIKWMKKFLSLFNGCILADEMGLGKTIQTLLLLYDYFKNTLIKHNNVIIITPSILLKNWINEINKFNIDLNVVVLNDNQITRNNLFLDNLNQNKIFITTYEKIILDFNLIKDVNFDFIILDEGQKIKNHNTKISQLIRSLKGKNKLLLSGTPIENNLLELWTIFDFVLPNFLGSMHQFQQTYNNNSSLAYLDFLNLKTSPFILRRTKNKYLQELPNKNVYDCWIDFKPQEKIEYQKLVTSLREKFVSINKKDKINMLSIITKLRMFCNINKQENSKYLKLVEILKEKLNDINNKIVIFCFFSSNLEVISNQLKEIGINNFLLTGKTKNRWKIISDFNQSKDTRVLLFSLKTGGVGINLTSANIVINYSPWWNESAENQAIDRSHRIGQNKNVVIYNLLMCDSIDMEVHKIKKQKTILIDNVINQIDYYMLLNKVFNENK